MGVHDGPCASGSGRTLTLLWRGPRQASEADTTDWGGDDSVAEMRRAEAAELARQAAEREEWLSKKAQETNKA